MKNKNTLNIRQIEYTTTKSFKMSIFLDHLIKSIVNVIFQYMIKTQTLLWWVMLSLNPKTNLSNKIIYGRTPSKNLVQFLGDLKTPKFPSEINWPLKTRQKNWSLENPEINGFKNETLTMNSMKNNFKKWSHFWFNTAFWQKNFWKKNIVKNVFFFFFF